MAEQTQTFESDDPKSEQFCDYIQHRQLEMLSDDLWDEYLWGELGAAVRDFENEPWGKPSKDANSESL
jgi:hypothetical protein